MSKEEIEDLKRLLKESKAREEQERREKEEARAREEQERRKNQKTTLAEYLYNCHFDLYQKLRPARSTSINTMSKKEIEDLKRLLEESKAREEEAKAREEEERREKEKAMAREELERRKNQETTLAEYLYNCHFDMYQKLRLASTSKSSTGLATSVDGRYYPKWLRPWRAFADSQRQEHFNDIIRTCGVKRLFPLQSTTWDMGMSFERKKAGYENAIEHFEKLAVEDPAWNILESIWTHERLRQKYQVTNLIFINGIRNFNNLDGDLEPRIKTERGKQQPDGAGIRIDIDGNESPAFMYDYKAAHKFAVEYLDAALAKETLFMDVHKWAQAEQYSTGSTVREKEETRIAMALIQVFNYMFWYGVSYGYVTAGTSLVLLHYDRAEPLVLRWHLCVPDRVVTPERTEPPVTQVSQTAVAQLASFCLLSLRSPALTGRPFEEALNQAKPILKKWKREDYTDPAIPPEQDDSDSSSAPPSRGTDKSFDSNAAPAARRIPLRTCRDPATPPKRHDDDEHGGAEDQQHQSGRGATLNRRQGGSSKKDGDDGPGGSTPAPTRQYCTQSCLLSLKLGRTLDSGCPNVLSHRVRGSAQHPINAKEFTELVGEQLRQDPYQSCDALIGRGKFGSSGVLFRLELAQFGYTFVGKGSVSERPRRLEHECIVYQRLEKLQGEVVPVHLGMVSLDHGYLLPGGASVVHMMLMSWAGEEATEAATPNLHWEVQRSVKTLYENGVAHEDERGPNLLWNVERGRVMVIDFDRSILLRPPQHKLLSELSTAGRKRRGDELRKYNAKRSLLGGSLQSVQ